MDIKEEAVRLLKNLVDSARPSFPKTPFRRALDEAKEFLAKEENRGDIQPKN